MDRDQLEYIRAHHDELGVELYSFARRWAYIKYDWPSGESLLGQDLEDVVMGVFEDYFDGTRKLKVGVEIIVQLRSAVRSELWSLAKRKGARAHQLEEETDETTLPASYVERKPRPDEQAVSADECDAILRLLWEHPKVKGNDDLAAYLLAVEAGADTPAEIAEIGGLPIERVYEARRSFNGIYPGLRRQVNKTSEQSYAK